MYRTETYANMEKYAKVYAWELVEKIAEGKLVYYLDRHLCDAGCVNGLTASKFCQLVRDKDEAGRYDFWYIESTQTVEV